jgi:methyltransferase (TIGR00027 family)
MHAIEKTALWVAGMRALESERENPLFTDPFAHRLAGENDVAILRSELQHGGSLAPAIEVRTRWLDDQTSLALARGVRQVVILASGMDSRAYRLRWPPKTRLYELDQPDVLAYKCAKLDGVAPQCERHEIAIDLAEDWPSALTASDFDPRRPTLWLVEGLLCYLQPEHVETLFARVDALSCKGSVVLADVLGRKMLETPAGKGLLEGLARQFGSDEPETLLTPLGWSVHAHLIAAIGHQLGRWPFPLHPRGTPGMPESFLVHAIKR